MIAAKSDLSAYNNDCLSVRNAGFTSGTGALHDISDGGEILFSPSCNLDRMRSVAGTTKHRLLLKCVHGHKSYVKIPPIVLFTQQEIPDCRELACCSKLSCV